jgi:hypothetical protein
MPQSPIAKSSYFLTVLIAASLAITPLLSADAFAKRGSLTTEQKTKFKDSKAALRKQRTTALARLRKGQAPFEKVKREFDRANREALASRADLNIQKANVAALTNWERTAAQQSRTPWTPSRQLARQIVALDIAEQRHAAGPKSNFDAVNARYQPVKTAYDRDMGSLRQASDGLVTRKANKDAARRENLETAIAAKAAKKRRAVAPNNAQAALEMPDFPNVPLTVAIQAPNQSAQQQRQTPAAPQRAPLPKVMFRLPAAPQQALVGGNRPLPPRAQNEPAYGRVPPLAQRAISNQYEAANSPLIR